MEQEASLISEDRNIPTQDSVPFPHSINAGSFVPVTGSGEANPNEGMNDTKFELSPSPGDNKSDYSTVVGFSSAIVISNFSVLCELIFLSHCSALQDGSLLSSTIGIQQSSPGDYVTKYIQELFITV